MANKRILTGVACSLLMLLSNMVRGEFLILDDYVIYDESKNGFMYYWATGDHYPENWPEDWTAPEDYYSGYWVARYEVFSTPRNLCHSYQLCIWQTPESGNSSSAAELETCSSPYTYVRGPDVYITQTDKLSDWWKKNSGANTPDLARPRDFERLGIVFRTCDGCYVTPYSTTPNCWSERANYLPVDMRITIVAVAGGETFSGWDNYIQGPKLEPPTLTPASMTYSGSALVEISASAEATEIRYTTDGSLPGPESPLYEGPIRLTESTVVLARTYADGFTPSNITSQRYVKRQDFGTDSLIAHWSFDGDLRDDVGRHDGTPDSGEVAFVEGRHGSALSLDDPVSAVVLPEIELNPLELTISAWVLPSGSDASAARFLSKGWGNPTAFPTQDIFFSSFAAFGSQLMFGLKVNNYTETVSGAAMLKNNIWAHVAATFDGSVMKIYKDGALVNDRSRSGQITPFSGRPFVIGNHSGGSEVDLKWGGALDDMRIYGRALNEEEIVQLYELDNASYPFPLSSLWATADRNDDGTAAAGSLVKVGDARYPEQVYVQGLGEPMAVLPNEGARLAADGGFYAWRLETGDWLWIAEDFGGWIYSYADGWFQSVIEIPGDSLWVDADRNEDNSAVAGGLGNVDDSGYPDYVYISKFREPVIIRTSQAARDAASGGFFAWRRYTADWVWTAEDLGGWVYSYRDGWQEL